MVNNLVNISIVFIATVIAEDLFPSASLPGWVNTMIHVAGVHVFARLVRRSDSKNLCHIFRNKPGKIHLRPIDVHTANVLSYLASPGQYGEMDGWKIGILKSQVRVEDLEQALELTDNAERSEEEQRILEGIVNFGSKDAKQVMTPRTDILSFDQEDSWEHVRAAIVASGFSRIPVREGSADQIAGILHVKDLLPFLHREKLDWLKVIRSPLYIPEGKN